MAERAATMTLGWGRSFDPDEVLPEFLEKTEFENYEFLFNFGFSATYYVY